MNKNDLLRGFGIYIVIFVIILGFMYINKKNSPDYAPYSVSYSTLLKDIDNSNVSKIELQSNSEVADVATAKVTSKEDGKKYTVVIPSVSTFTEYVSKYVEKDSDLQIVTVAPSNVGNLFSIVIAIVSVVVVVLIFMLLFQQMQSNGGKMLSFGKSRAKLSEGKNDITFKDVAGLYEEKTEVEEIVDFLKSPKKYTELGARIPKGILMVGSPGTGKTLLAKAISGEAKVPFFSISGSDFVEMFVGVGASRVRDLFEQAKKNAPCLVFIDEIDAVGRKRGTGLGGGHDEREQTLNQLLVEMDGFGINEGVIVIAATNRPDILDPALLRPGRFDRQIVVGVPDVKGREEILKIHAKGKKLAEDVDLKDVAATTQGFTGADLENLLNEAALLTARKNEKLITMENIRQSFVRVAIGAEKKSHIISEEDRKITAYHEAGHAILFEKLPSLSPVHTVSIIPIGRMGGYTMPIPKEDGFKFKKEMQEEIVSLFGGRVAEELIFGDYTAGASNDIMKASNQARNMVKRFGMSGELGPVLYGEEESHEIFLGNEIGHTRNYGEEIATQIDKEVRRIVDEAYETAKKILSENMNGLHATAKLLLEKEKVTGEEFREVLNNV